MNKSMKLRVWCAALLLALVAAACSSDGIESIASGNDDTSTSTSASSSSNDADADESNADSGGDSGGDTTTDGNEADNGAGNNDDGNNDDGNGASMDFDGDFCSIAMQMELADPLQDLDFSDPEEFFTSAADLWSDIADVVPPELQGDAAIIQANLDDFLETGRQFDFDITDPEFGAAMEQLDSAEMDAASERFDTYLSDVCGIDTGSDFEDDFGDLGGGDDIGVADINIDPNDLEDFGDLENLDSVAGVLQQVFGIEQELAECLGEELGPEFDLDNPPADLITREVCGTTLLEVFSGIG